jgi:hypothetical protein
VFYVKARKNHPPVEIVREAYTAKFVYLGPDKKQVGAGLDRYDSIEGYENGIAAVISNMANTAAHRGRVKHIPAADLFSALLKCQDSGGEQYFLSIARDRITVSSYMDDRIRKQVEEWTDTVPALR